MYLVAATTSPLLWCSFLLLRSLKRHIRGRCSDQHQYIYWFSDSRAFHSQIFHALPLPVASLCSLHFRPLSPNFTTKTFVFHWFFTILGLPSWSPPIFYPSLRFFLFSSLYSRLLFGSKNFRVLLGRLCFFCVLLVAFGGYFCVLTSW